MPRKSSSKIRPHRLITTCSSSEYQTIRAAALAEGLTIGGYLRRLALARAAELTQKIAA